MVPTIAMLGDDLGSKFGLNAFHYDAGSRRERRGKGRRREGHLLLLFAFFASSREIKWMPSIGVCLGFGSHEGRKKRRAALLSGL